MKKIISWLCLFAIGWLPLFSSEIQEEEHPVLILGAGIGALTSATYLARAGITPVVIMGPYVGGTIIQSHHVENWPGEVSISGLELSQKVKKQAEVNGADLREEVVISIDFSKQPYTVVTKQSFGGPEKKYRTNACIIAMGSQPNLLQIPGEKEYWARGVYSCAVCDGGFYKDKPVAVVGGGDSALLEAQYLTNIASHVHLIVRKDAFRSIEKQRMKEILSHPKISVHYQTVVSEVSGDGEKVLGLVLQKEKQREILAVDALFLAIGSRPNTQLFNGQLELENGYIILKKHQQTSKEGIYALGDVSDPEFKQAISAAGDAAKAAMQAQSFIASQASLARKVEKVATAVQNEVIEIKSVSHFENEMRQAEGPVIIDFYATYCGPCRMFSPTYDEWAKKYGDRVKFLKVNAPVVAELSERFNIRGVPTLIVLDKKGNITQKVVGLADVAEIQKKLENQDLR